MAQKLGRLMIWQYPDPDTPGSYINVCGFNTTSFTVTNEIGSEKVVNCTNREDIVTMIKTYGAQDFKFSGNGLFEDTVAGTKIQLAAINQEKLPGRMFVPGVGYFECEEWLVPSVQWDGKEEGHLNCAVSLEASGTVTPTYLAA